MVNESLSEFQRLLVDLQGRWEQLFIEEAARGVLVSPGEKRQGANS